MIFHFSVWQQNFVRDTAVYVLIKEVSIYCGIIGLYAISVFGIVASFERCLFKQIYFIIRSICP